MKIKTEKLTVSTKGNCDVVNITESVQSLIDKYELHEGNVTVFVVGSTASISTIEYEPGLRKDLPQLLEKLIPSGQKYFHNDTWGDHNGHAHLRSTLFGCSQTIPFIKGDLMLGTWQQIIVIDFDERPRERKIIVQLVGE
ncbi:MAG: YjbQ family protein [Ignavibacteriae bacterium]|nr:MAG: YjbQ family protein [Ignavibacteriota bacterium]